MSKKRKRVFELTLTSILGAVIMVLSLVPQLGFITIAPGITVTIVHIPVIIGIFLLNMSNSLLLGFLFGLGSLIAALSNSEPFNQAFINPLVSIVPRVIFAYLTVYLVRAFKLLNNSPKGKTLMFVMVSVITSFAFLFGIDNALKLITPEHFSNVAKVSRPITLLFIFIFIGLYYYVAFKKKSHVTYIPSVFIISTVIHTIVVLTAVFIVRPKVFFDTFGENQSVLGIIFMIAMVNGLIEAIVAAIIGTPIAIATTNYLEGDRE
ncbi:MAG: hypothetical protein RBQ97_02990 [Acholeplasma sp.]|nr:hypothetical protein [Acholeplasma sp.]